MSLNSSFLGYFFQMSCQCHNCLHMLLLVLLKEKILIWKYFTCFWTISSWELFLHSLIMDWSMCESCQLLLQVHFQTSLCNFNQTLVNNIGFTMHTSVLLKTLWELCLILWCLLTNVRNVHYKQFFKSCYK
jgi:hypothetical protein